jgi:hypothetical protein
VEVASVSTSGGEFYEATFAVDVADDQLTVSLASGTHRAALNGLEVRAHLDVTGPSVTALGPTAPVSTASALTLVFSEAIETGSFTLADVVSLTGPGGAVTPTDVARLSETEYAVEFPVQSDPGAYTIVVGPDITDVAGNAMDQDGDGTPGEPVEDRFEGSFSIVSAAPIENPTDIANLVLWLDADPGYLYTDVAGTTPVTDSGQAVALWSDRSGLDADFTQEDPAARPLYDVDAWDGDQRGVRFDGLDDIMTLADTSALDPGQGDWTVSAAVSFYTPDKAYLRQVIGKRDTGSPGWRLAATGDGLGPTRFTDVELGSSV